MNNNEETTNKVVKKNITTPEAIERNRLRCEKLYNQLITKRQSNLLSKKKRGIVEKIKTEIHHILPKACGGNGDKSNLVVLTAKEHFMAHYFLANMYIKHTPEWISMTRAFYMMKADKDGKRYHNSRLYAKNRENYIDSITGENHPNFGAFHITNGKDNAFAKDESEIKEGWYRGRTNSPDYVPPSLGKIWITNGTESLMVPDIEDSELLEGWYKGSHYKKNEGKVWIVNDGRTEQRQIFPEETIEDGWSLGALHRGLTWITDGSTNKRHVKDDPIPKNWWKGRTCVYAEKEETIRITNGLETIYISIDDDIPDGYWEKMHLPNNEGSRYINNGEKTIMIPLDKEIPLGWVEGTLNKDFMYINDGKETITINKFDNIPDGYKRGKYDPDKIITITNGVGTKDIKSSETIEDGWYELFEPLMRKLRITNGELFLFVSNRNDIPNQWYEDEGTIVGKLRITNGTYLKFIEKDEPIPENYWEYKWRYVTDGKSIQRIGEDVSTPDGWLPLHTDPYWVNNGINNLKLKTNIIPNGYVLGRAEFIKIHNCVEIKKINKNDTIPEGWQKCVWIMIEKDGVKKAHYVGMPMEDGWDICVGDDYNIRTLVNNGLIEKKIHGTKIPEGWQLGSILMLTKTRKIMRGSEVKEIKFNDPTPSGWRCHKLITIFKDDVEKKMLGTDKVPLGWKIRRYITIVCGDQEKKIYNNTTIPFGWSRKKDPVEVRASNGIKEIRVVESKIPEGYEKGSLNQWKKRHNK